MISFSQTAATSEYTNLWLMFYFKVLQHLIWRVQQVKTQFAMEAVKVGMVNVLAEVSVDGIHATEALVTNLTRVRFFPPCGCACGQPKCAIA